MKKVSKAKKIVAIADNHTYFDIDVPDGDILICAGDITSTGELSTIHKFNEFLGSLPHKHKVVIAGNHDFCFEKRLIDTLKLLTNCTYLHDSGVQIDDIYIYGSPWQPWFLDWAFNLPRGGQELKKIWNLIPEKTNILVTHSPPLGFGDITKEGEACGCEDLLAAVERVKPQAHIFGHIHEGYGIYENDETLFINASICTRRYQPINKPITFVYDNGAIKDYL